MAPAAVAGLGGLARDVAEICRIGALTAADPAGWLRGPIGIVPIVLVAAGLLLAAGDRLWQQRRLRYFLAAHRTRPLREADPVHPAARRLGIAARVEVIEGPGLPAFVAGFIRPRIFLSASLFTALSEAELAATFRHEVEHLRRRDPVRLALIRFAERVLFWVPAAKALAAKATATLEARADDAAAVVGRLDLASAIVKTARMSRPAPGPIAALHHTPATWRVRRLLDDAPATPPSPSSRVSASLVLLGLLWAGALLARPLGEHPAAPCNTCVLREQITRQPDHGAGPAGTAPFRPAPPRSVPPG